MDNRQHQQGVPQTSNGLTKAAIARIMTTAAASASMLNMGGRVWRKKSKIKRETSTFMRKDRARRKKARKTAYASRRLNQKRMEGRT